MQLEELQYNGTPHVSNDSTLLHSVIVLNTPNIPKPSMRRSIYAPIGSILFYLAAREKESQVSRTWHRRLTL